MAQSINCDDIYMDLYVFVIKIELFIYLYFGWDHMKKQQILVTSCVIFFFCIDFPSAVDNDKNNVLAPRKNDLLDCYCFL